MEQENKPLSESIDKKINTIRELVGREPNYRYHRDSILNDIKEDIKEVVERVKEMFCSCGRTHSGTCLNCRVIKEIFGEFE